MVVLISREGLDVVKRSWRSALDGVHAR